VPLKFSERHPLSQSGSPAETLVTGQLTSSVSGLQSQTQNSLLMSSVDLQQSSPPNAGNGDPASDSSNSFVIVSSAPSEPNTLVSKNQHPATSKMSHQTQPQQRPPLHDGSRLRPTEKADSSTPNSGPRNQHGSKWPGKPSPTPVSDESSQEEYIDEKTRWRLRENQLLQIINELETNLRGSRREAENQKIQVLATQQRLTTEIESLSRELFSLKNLLSTSRANCTRLYEDNAKLRATAAGLDEEKQSLILKLNIAAKALAQPQTEEVRSTIVDPPPNVDIQLLDEIRGGLLDCLKQVEGETWKQLSTLVEKLERCSKHSSAVSKSQNSYNSQSELEHSLTGEQIDLDANPDLYRKELYPSSQVKKLQEKVVELEKLLLEHSVFKNEMIRKNETLERRVQQVQEEKQVALNDLKNSMDQLLRENKRVTKDYLHQSKKAESLQASSDEFQSKVGETEGKFQFLTKELQSKSLALDISTEEAIRNRKELTALRNQLDETRDRYEILERSKELLAKRCLSLEQVIEGIKMSNLRKVSACDVEDKEPSQEPDRLTVLEERYEAVLKEKFALQKKCDEHDGRLHSQQEHIFDLETELRERDEEIEIMRKQTSERELQLDLKKAEINQIISNAERRTSSAGEPAADLDEFGLRPVDQDVLTQLLKTLFPSFFKDEGLRVI